MSGTKIRELLDTGEIVLMPNAWDGLSARLAEEAGFRGVFAAGSVISASMGYPDMELYGKADMLSRIRDMRLAVDISIMADLDTGWGGVLQCARAVREFENAGSAAAFIEDQVSPKRCPKLDSGGTLPLVDIEEAKGKVRAAVEARESMLIVARTDAAGDEIYRRGEAYAEAGADMIFPTTLDPSFGPDQWAELHRRVGIPLMGHGTVGHWMQSHVVRDPASLYEAGVRIAIVPLHGLFAAITAIRGCYARVAAGEDLADLAEEYLDYGEFSDLLGYPALSDAEHRYLA
ncbi:MAG: oxaloacetate decarboxylase [Acidimicrobiia bacterium]